MWENQKHHLIYALIIADLTYLIEIQFLHVAISVKTNIDLTNIQNLL